MDPIDVETVWFILHITFYTILPDIATDMIAYLSFSYSGTAVDEKPLHQSDKSWFWGSCEFSEPLLMGYLFHHGMDDASRLVKVVMLVIGITLRFSRSISGFGL